MNVSFYGIISELFFKNENQRVIGFVNWLPVVTYNDWDVFTE